MGIDWGVPAQRQQKKEQFSTPVVTMSALAGKGTGRKFSFNKAAIAAMGLVSPDEETGAQSFVTVGKNTETGEIVIMASSEEKEGMQFFKTNKSFSFSDKKTYEFISRTLQLEDSVEKHLHIEEVVGDGYFKVTSVVHEGQDVAKANTALDSTTEGADVSEGMPVEAEIAAAEAQVEEEEEMATMPSPTAETEEVEDEAEEAEAPAVVAIEEEGDEW